MLRVDGQHRGQPLPDERLGDRGQLGPLLLGRDEPHARADAERDVLDGRGTEAGEQRGRLGAEELRAEGDRLPLGGVLGQEHHAVAALDTRALEEDDGATDQSAEL